MTSTAWEPASIPILSGVGCANLLLAVPVLSLRKRSWAFTSRQPRIVDLADFSASPFVEGNRAGRGLPRFDQSLESFVLLPFRLSKLLKVVRETQAGAGAIEMMEEGLVVLAPTAAVTRLSVLDQQTQRFLKAGDPAPGFRPRDGAAATAVESANIAVPRLVTRVPAPSEVTAAFWTKNTISE